MWWSGEIITAERQLPLLPPLRGCLSVSSASVPPYTLSHFSPMSLQSKGEGGRKRLNQGKRQKEEKTKRNSEEEKKKTDQPKEEMDGMKENMEFNKCFKCLFENSDYLFPPHSLFLNREFLLSSSQTNIPPSAYAGLASEANSSSANNAHV